MKKCPFCAEEIQDEAIVCKHCGRDLSAGVKTPPPQKIEVVEKKKTGCVAGGCAVVLVILGVGFIMSLCSTPTGSLPRPSARPAARALTTGKGAFKSYSYEYQSQGKNTVFLFEPPLPMDDALAVEAIRHLLTTEYRANAGNATWRAEGQAMRFTTPAGQYDVLPVKEESNTQVLGFGITPR